MWLTSNRYQAAAEPVDLEKLKIPEEEAVMEDVAEDEEDEEEEDAALEDVKDLYDDDEEGTGKKRKRAATDDGEDQKPGRKKVTKTPFLVWIDPRNRLWLYNKRKNVNLINLNKTVLQNARNPVQNPKINKSSQLKN